MKKTLLVLAIGVAWQLEASVSVIDFQSLPVGPIAGDNITLSADGVSVRFSGPGLQVRDVGYLGAGADRVLSTSIDAGPITAAFQNGFLANYVEIRNWLPQDGSEVDFILGKSYDSANYLLDTQQNANSIFHLGGGTIASAVYVEANFGQGFLLDNFTFTEVPESAAGLTLLTVTGLLLLARKCARSPMPALRKSAD